MQKNYFIQLLTLGLLVCTSFQLTAQQIEERYLEYLIESEVPIDSSFDLDSLSRIKNKPIDYKSLTPKQSADLSGDSLALVALYNATDGKEWRTPWNLDDPITTWSNLTIRDNRVVLLLLEYENLNGVLPAELGDLTAITLLWLQGNSISGSIPSEIGNLVDLNSLKIWNNQLTGAIPSSLGNLSRLTELELQNNSLTDMIPDEIGNLSRLQKLDLSNNLLDGVIPPQIGNLNQLRTVFLNDNELSGAIPPELGNLNNLNELRLQNNTLSGSIPSNFGGLAKLETLDLSSNGSINGTIPDEIGNLSKLVNLVLSNNSLSGSLPTSLGNLEQLVYLDLSNNALSGTIPVTLANISQLEWVFIFDNNLMGELPANLGSLTNIRFLEAHNNQLSGCFPNSYTRFCDNAINFSGNSGLPNSGDFSAFCNNGTGACCTTEADLVVEGIDNVSYDAELFSAQVTFKNVGQQDANLGGSSFAVYASANNRLDNDAILLRRVAFSNNILLAEETMSLTISDLFFDAQLYNHLIIDVNDNEELLECDFINNDYAIIIPNSILRALDSLSLVALYEATDGVNWFTPWDLSQPINTWAGIRLYVNGDDEDRVREVSIWSNNLNGNLPAAFFKLTKIQSVLIQWNRDLSGSIPLQIGNLNNLRNLNLAGNRLNGVIPTSIERLTQLEEVDMRGNQLSGVLPKVISNLVELHTLNFNDNQLSGIIPAEYGNLSNLETLRIGGNRLTGNIPTTFAQLKLLEVLWVSSNQLSGELPVELSQLQNLRTFNVSRNGFTGTIPTEYMNLTNLTHFYFADNLFSGELPASLNQLSNLIFLEVYGNILSGNFPEIPSLTRLAFFRIQNNNFSGSLPPSLTTLTQLEQILVENNEFTGNIPTGISQLENLRIIRINNNNLSGCFPEDFDFLCNAAQIAYNFNNNPLLPWQGDYARFCNGEEQIGAECNDGDPNTENDVINADCSCGNAVVLNVDILDFQVSLQTETAKIEWEVANETNFSYYDIQRSIDSENWSTIGTQVGENKNKYQYNDYEVIEMITNNKPVYYRLQLVDLDSSVAYSPIRSIRIKTMDEVAIFPNPTTGEITIHFQNEQNESPFSIGIFTMDGKRVAKRIIVNSTTAQTGFNLSHLPHGVYLIQINNGDRIITKRLILE